MYLTTLIHRLEDIFKYHFLELFGTVCISGRKRDEEETTRPPPKHGIPIPHSVSLSS